MGHQGIHKQQGWQTEETICKGRTESKGTNGICKMGHAHLKTNGIQIKNSAQNQKG